MAPDARHRPGQQGGVQNDQAGGPVKAKGTPPERTFRALPERRALPHVPALTTRSWTEAVTYADRVATFGYDCYVWAEVVAC